MGNFGRILANNFKSYCFFFVRFLPILPFELALDGKLQSFLKESVRGCFWKALKTSEKTITTGSIEYEVATFGMPFKHHARWTNCSVSWFILMQLLMVEICISARVWWARINFHFNFLSIFIITAYIMTFMSHVSLFYAVTFLSCPNWCNKRGICTAPHDNGGYCVCDMGYTGICLFNVFIYICRFFSAASLLFALQAMTVVNDFAHMLLSPCAWKLYPNDVRFVWRQAI